MEAEPDSWSRRYRGPAAAELPQRLSLRGLKRAASGCEACPLYRDATQTVFGDGKVGSQLMIVGEQPGDHEDRQGSPFVGPAGRLLDQVLEGAGISRETTYVTNAVKHFKWHEGRGKRRIHDKPSRSEVEACLPWLRAELEVVSPEVVVLMGATAAKAVLGSKVRVTKDRGALFDPEEGDLPGDRPLLTVTLHPSAVLRIDDRDERHAERDRMINDFKAVAEQLETASTAG